VAGASFFSSWISTFLPVSSFPSSKGNRLEVYSTIRRKVNDPDQRQTPAEHGGVYGGVSQKEALEIFTRTAHLKCSVFLNRQSITLDTSSVPYNNDIRS
jgi:hypothetical protein